MDKTNTPAPEDLADESWRGPCSDNPQHWDLDTESSTLADWLHAERICRDQCPFLSRCLAQLNASGERPIGAIYAGKAYSDSGTELSNASLRTLASRVRNQRKREREAADRVLQVPSLLVS